MSTLRVQPALRVAAFVSAGFAAIAANAELPRYELSAPPMAYITDLNNRGQLVGISYEGSAIYDSRNGTLTVLPLPRAASYAINDWGTVGGTLDLSVSEDDYSDAPFVLRNGRLKTISTPGYFGNTVKKINNSGQVIGTWGRYWEGEYWGFFKDKDASAEVVTLGADVRGAYTSSASSINNEGEVVGVVAGEAFRKSFIYRNGKYTFLPDKIFAASAINDAQTVVGTRYIWDESKIAYTFMQGAVYRAGKFTALHGVHAGDHFGAVNINRGGLIIGFSMRPNKEVTRRAVIYADGRAHDLNALTSNLGKVVLRNVLDINNRGQILAVDYTIIDGNYPGEQTFYLLTPVRGEDHTRPAALVD